MSVMPMLPFPSTCSLRIVLLYFSLFLQACSIKPGILPSAVWRQPSPEAMQARLLDVSYPLLTAAADWCPFDQEPTNGFLLRGEAGPAGIEPSLSPGKAVVAYVHPRLPAALAGLSVGDAILLVNTVNVTGDSADKVGGLIGRLTRAKIQPLQLDVLKGGDSHTIAMSAVPACHYAMQVLDTDLINGITDGRRIGVTRGALRFFESDDELGWVVAHEIAHNILSHVQNAKLHAILLAFLAARGEESSATAATPPRRSLESQADYVGAYLMARAGYDLSAITRVWERLERLESRQPGQRSGLALTHPPTKERRAAFDVTLQEIESKLEAAQPLEILLNNHGESSQ